MRTPLREMLERGAIPNAHAVWIDCYNRNIRTDGICDTITLRTDPSNNYFVTVIPPPCVTN